MMMMMMKKKKGSLALVALLVASVNCILQPSKDDLISKFHCGLTYKNSFPFCIYLHFTCYFITCSFYIIFLNLRLILNTH